MTGAASASVSGVLIFAAFKWGKFWTKNPPYVFYFTFGHDVGFNAVPTLNRNRCCSGKLLGWAESPQYSIRSPWRKMHGSRVLAKAST